MERFLRRTGFACRELLEAEADGSWRDAYDVLTRMEWAGTVRRGYFVDGIAGSQFMTPGVRLENTKHEIQNTKRRACIGCRCWIRRMCGRGLRRIG